MGEEGKKESKEDSRFHLWRDGPTLVQAVVAVLALLGVGGVAGVVHSVASSHHTSRNTTQSGSGPVRWQGAIAVNTSGINLDDVPPTTGGSAYTITDSGGSLFSGSGGSFAVWPGSSAPAYGQCRDFVLTHGSTSSVQLTSDMDLCIRTSGGRTAFVKITSVSGDGSSAEAQATIWQSVS